MFFGGRSLQGEIQHIEAEIEEKIYAFKL